MRRACELVRDGQMSRAMSILHSLGIAHISDGVLAQLGAKHPSRQGGHTVPATLPADGGTQLPDLEPVELTETFRQLPSRAGCFRDGLRNEHLRALVGTFPDAEADQVMPMYDEFATALARVELPAWFYSTLMTSGLVPLVKTRLTPAQVAAGEEPDVRPIAVGSCALRAILRQVTSQLTDAVARRLAPVCGNLEKQGKTHTSGLHIYYDAPRPNYRFLRP